MTHHRRHRHRGITLIELMIALAVVAILAAMAVPAYSEYLSRSHRVDARGTLTQAAQWMERYRAESRGVYTGATIPAALAVSPGSGAVMYDLSLTMPTAVSYVLSAVPRTGGRMAGDACGTFTLTSDGQRTAAGASSGALFERCWNR